MGLQNSLKWEGDSISSYQMLEEVQLQQRFEILSFLPFSSTSKQLHFHYFYISLYPLNCSVITIPILMFLKLTFAHKS